MATTQECWEQFWVQHFTKHQLYGHLTAITKTIKVRRTRHAGHSWRSRDELISDELLWTPSYGRTKAGRPPRAYIQQLWNVDLRTSQKRWTIGRSGERGSGISVLVARHDDDDDHHEILGRIYALNDITFSLKKNYCDLCFPINFTLKFKESILSKWLDFEVLFIHLHTFPPNTHTYTRIYQCTLWFKGPT